jgi:P-type Ca2+ transporter type 2C
MLLSPFLGSPLPLLPLQLLWLNLMTDGLLGLGMGVENPEPDTMKRTPHSPTEGVFSRGAGYQTIWVGVMIGTLALGLGAWYFFTDRPEWQTMIFTSLAFMQVFQAVSSRSQKESALKMGLSGNSLLTGMIFLVVALQMLVIYVPAFSDFFEVTPLGAVDLVIATGAGLVVFVFMEVVKLAKRE